VNEGQTKVSERKLKPCGLPKVCGPKELRTLVQTWGKKKRNQGMREERKKARLDRYKIDKKISTLK
jgi:hypothetical protein